MKALIVEDEAEFRLLLSVLLRQCGYDVIEAMDGMTAWEIIQSTPIPLVLTDWVMPQMQGPELIQKIRRANFPYYTYIILLTARTAHRDVIDGILSGADDYLVKPFDQEELRARLSIAERILGLETRLRETMEQLRLVALRDGLTGVYNRRAICEIAENELERSRREATELSFLMIDIDNFKKINDRFGHSTGDAALRLVVDTIVKHLRAYDSVGRWGGEEFLVILPNTSPDEAVLIAERLRTSVEKAGDDLPDEQSLDLHISLGVTCTSFGENHSLDKLVSQADQALYQAKNLGKNQVCAYR